MYAYSLATRLLLPFIKTCPEWVALDIGIQQIGAINVPVLIPPSARENTNTFSTIQKQKYALSEKTTLRQGPQSASNVPSLKEVYTLDWQEGTLLGGYLLRDEGTRKKQRSAKQRLARMSLHLIYTSGTTGAPKGVMLSHNNIVNVLIVKQIFPVTSAIPCLAFCPLPYL